MGRIQNGGEVGQVGWGEDGWIRLTVKVGANDSLQVTLSGSAVVGVVVDV
jgi:hypothetical protein